jgi:hypothetical protein
MQQYTYIGLILLSLSFYACAKKKVTATEYMTYMEQEKNGLKVSKTIGDICYSVQYKTPEYVLLKENTASLSALKKKDIEEMQYYTLQYSLTDKSKDILKAHLQNNDDYLERSNYFSFGLQEDIYLVDGKDTLPCKLFNYVNSYGLSPKADFVLAFDGKPKKEVQDKLLVIEDNVYGGGIIKLKIEKENIQQIPELTAN